MLKHSHGICMLRHSAYNSRITLFRAPTGDAVAADYVCVTVRWTHKCIESKRLDLLYKFVVNVYTSLYVPHPLHLWAQEAVPGLLSDGSARSKSEAIPIRNKRFRFFSLLPARSRREKSFVGSHANPQTSRVIFQIPNNRGGSYNTGFTERAAKLRSSLEGRTSNIWRISTLSIFPPRDRKRSAFDVFVLPKFVSSFVDRRISRERIPFSDPRILPG